MHTKCTFTRTYTNYPLCCCANLNAFFSYFVQGTADQRITFTTQPNSGYAEVTAVQPKELGARLVDGPSPLAGRLQLYHADRWRSVCTNSRK